MDIAVQLLATACALAIVAAILHAAFAQRFLFIVTIDRAGVRVSKGRVRAEFVDVIREICQEYGVASGWVGGVKQGKSIALRFSRTIPPSCQQRLRNIWTSG